MVGLDTHSGEFLTAQHIQISVEILSRGNRLQSRLVLCAFANRPFLGTYVPPWPRQVCFLLVNALCEG